MSDDVKQASSIKALQIVVLSTAMFSAMGGPALAPALPAIRASYHDIPDIEFWTKILISISGLFAALGAPLFGWLSDRFGRRKTLAIALFFWGCFGVSGAIPQPFWALLVERAAFGLSLGGLLVANLAMIADSFERTQQRQMMGLQSAFASSGVVVSVLISGYLADFHWRYVFFMFLPAFAILPLVFFCPSTEKREQTKSVSLLPQVFPLTLVCVFGFVAMMIFNVIPTQLPFFMGEHGVKSSSRIGLLLAILPVSSAIAGRLYVRTSRYFGLWNLFVVVGVLMLTGFYTIGVRAEVPNVVFGLLLIGMGFGTAIPHSNIVLARLMSREVRGRAMGILTGCKFIGLFASPLLLQPLLARSDYNTLFHCSGWIMLITTLVICLLGWSRLKGLTEEKDSV